jgi:TP901 family phage tail tape measure protein
MANEAPVKVRLTALDKLSGVLDKVKGKFPEMSRAVARTNAEFGVFQKTTEKFAKSAERIGKKFQSVGTAMSVGITLPVIAAGAASVRAFAEYETALVGVGKTTNISGAELQALGQQFLKLSKEIPVSSTELLQLGQTAAQLGVSGSDNVLKFSATLAKLSRASDVAGEEGAANLARFITVTRGSVANVENYASALVALGNTSAATESEILSFALRLGASTSIFNVTGEQSLGIATALKSVGIEAEAGSSAVQRAMGNMNEAIGKGGQQMEMLSRVTGIAAKDLKERFKTDAVGVLREFAAGLDKVEKSGGDVSQALAYFGMTGVRDIQVLGALSKNVGLLDEKLAMASKGFKENTALQAEFSAQVGTLDNQWQLFKNRIGVVAIALGEKLKPAIIKVFGAIEAVFSFLEGNPTLLYFIAAIAGLMAVLGPLLIFFGTMLAILPQAVAGWALLTTAMAAFGVTSWAALAPILLIMAKFILIGALIAGLIYIVWKFRDAIIDGVVWALEKLWSMLKIIQPQFAAMEWVWNKFTGAGPQAAEGVGATPAGAALSSNLSPQGAPLGGLETQQQANPEFSQQTNNARVDINVRAPQSTTIQSEQQGGFLSINRGMAGAF